MERIVTIHRRNNMFVKLPKELKVDTKTKIGSTWVRGTTDILRGLSPQEEEKYLPSIIGISPKSEHWVGAVREYWANFIIDVPEAGLQLNISKTDNGEPVNTDHYMKWKFASKHVNVASTDEQLANKDAFPFYMVDSIKEKEEKQSKYELATLSDKAFVKLLEFEEQRQRYVYDLVRDREHPLNPSGEDMMLLLRGVKEKNPARFIDAMKDKDAEYKYLINQLLRAGVISKEGDTFFDGDKTLGKQAELIAWLKEPANQADKLKLEKRLSASTI